ncbi:MAG: TatD family hydrolase [Actinomycetales bacterium]|nr:TatD family hydrolase [Actinomycetales bacterium]
MCASDSPRDDIAAATGPAFEDGAPAAYMRTRGGMEADAKRDALKYPPLPEPLEVGTYDNHCHMEIADGDTPLHYLEHLELANQAGMLGVVQVGVTLESSKWSAAVAAIEPRVLAAVALHPNEAPLYGNQQKLDEAIAQIADLATQPRVRAIGETGLDFFRTQGEDELALQRHSFEDHIIIAKENNLALMIHDREAHAEVVETLKRLGAPERVVFHCYSGDTDLAEICNENGWYMSFAGNVTIKRNQHLRDSLKIARPELIMVETDAPFLTPEPFRGRPNASYLVPITVRYMAEQRGIGVNEMAAQLTANTERVYGSWAEGLLDGHHSKTAPNAPIDSSQVP